VEDQLGPLDGTRQRLVVQDVAFDQIDLVGEVGQVLALARREVVDDADLVAPGQQRARQRRSDEAGSAGDQAKAHD